MGIDEERRKFIKRIIGSMGVIFGVATGYSLFAKEEYKTVHGDITKVYEVQKGGYLIKLKETSGEEYTLYFDPTFCYKGPCFHEIPDGSTEIKYKTYHPMKSYDRISGKDVDGTIVEINPTIEEKTIAYERDIEKRLKESGKYYP